MAFAKRRCRSSSVPKRRARSNRGRRRHRPRRRHTSSYPYGALTCGTCRACREGRDKQPLRGCRWRDGLPHRRLRPRTSSRCLRRGRAGARLVVPVPDGVEDAEAACAGIAFGPVAAHAVTKTPSSSPVRACSSMRAVGHRHRRDPHGQGPSAARCNHGGATRRRAPRPPRFGADHVINYRTERFEGEVRRLTKRKGVTWCSSMSAPIRGTAHCSA